ncbi:TetR/AcrR family transcriptional regulator [Streptomonospora nanhaiensis]|uniref:AcrR family transcriptional regulator n=1 Tax=Streptomonospora nanhaiensis TaxID=1323731 RepID=A0A853BRM3_9ACTN|nr:TetR family transcriptional regulator [Streptomonospora nanhaiensis]MBV2362176.1 TetR family transcriptional regulator [Streptomonospora nanhaiensis]MBX9388175.1 TetR family transcriptional regulator [Streptomonospora nanhaiensis]NYI97385.1 AcrR family transcriptional regulator [Streptomonospora nanhaiensis]
MGNREELLAGAKRCLREKGYDRTSVRDIAAAAGVSTAAIGYHYGSRETLLNKALFELLDEWGDSVGRALAPGAGDDAAQGFARMWAGLVEQFREHPDLWVATVELFLQSRRQPDLRAQLARGVSGGWRGMAAILESVPEDEVSDRSARTLGMVQTALMAGVMIQSLSDPDNAPTAEEVLEGLRALAATARPA